jgi:predicted ATPase with chaperone activity
MDTYRESVIIQSISGESLSPKSLEDAFADLVVDKSILDLLGPAMASGKGVFLFGNSGNGKTSLALRMSRAYTYAVYIPHAILMGGRVVQVYDPQVHRAQPRGELAEDLGGERLDKRWVRCHRPVVIAGGELTLDSLELEYSEDTGLCEAPLQLKANCGLLLIDDFGRQRVDFHELLNRWILPLENRVDYLRLPNGRKVQTPFDPLLVFSTNLDPGKLVDEAFIRRIPYKIHIPDPTPESYRILLEREAEAMGFAPRPKALDYLIRTCYTETKREMRYCHPRDLLLQVRNQCLYRRQPLDLTKVAIDSAARGYFTLL